MTMRRFIGCLLAALAPATAGAQPAIEPTGALLSLDEAVRIAVAHNRQVLTASLEVEKSGEDLAIARIRRRPTFDTELSASKLLTPVEVRLPARRLRRLPRHRPDPGHRHDGQRAATADRRTSRRRVAQPISQLFRINLGVRSAETDRGDRDAAGAGDSGCRSSTTSSRLYFAILQTQSALAANEEAIALYRELDRTLPVRVAQKVALRERCDRRRDTPGAGRARRALRLNTLASQKEQLNQLLGRDVRTRVRRRARCPRSRRLEIDLDGGAARALAERPDLQQARLDAAAGGARSPHQEGRAHPRRQRRASATPRTSTSTCCRRTSRPFGVQVKWEPFDWGRSAQRAGGEGAHRRTGAARGLAISRIAPSSRSTARSAR